MKKKFTLFALAALCLTVLLAGCKLFNDEPAKIYNFDYSTDGDYLVGLTDSVIDSCVEVYGASPNILKSASGSGVVVYVDADKTETYILTNSHVVTAESSGSGGAGTVFSKIEVSFFGSSSKHAATIVERSASNDTGTDLALLKVNYYNKKNRPVKLYSGQLKYAQHILAIGNGQNLGTSVCDGLISNPSITFKNNIFNKEKNLTCELIQITAGINSGNSGGALFDMAGNLIGINTLKLVSDEAFGSDGKSTVSVFADNISFSLPVSNIQKFMADRSRSGFLTVEGDTVMGITVTAPPAKTNYYCNEEIDFTNGEIEVAWASDKKTTVRMADTSVGKSDHAAQYVAGQQDITLTYGGKVTTLAITVSVDTVSGITVKTLPTKMHYSCGEAFYFEGGEIEVAWASGKNTVMSMTDTSVGKSATVSQGTAGAQEVTLTYEGESAIVTFEVE
ncbi:MAG: trypsin-like peptidase domain-containing protein [Clostridiales bacterium]|nr:trypsin-like peptidase domain-containing protein [Clostridiales bacterium]